MQFLLLIQSSESGAQNTAPAERDRMFTKYMNYTQDLVKSGVMRGGDPLQTSHKGARVSVREGKTHIVDGPFTEAKEVLGGYYLLECASLDEAKKWAAKCPGAEYGTMEVREVMVMPKK